MISAGELRPGTKVEHDGHLWEVITFEHIKMGRGTALVRTRLRNLGTGAVSDETFRPEERFTRARIERVDVQYLYRDGEQFIVMDTNTFDQFPLSPEQIGEAARFLKESDHLYLLEHEGKVLGVELPISVELEVTETEPGFKGDTATGTFKPATLSSGLVLDVPLFIAVGDRVKVDTRTGRYVERVQ